VTARDAAIRRALDALNLTDVHPDLAVGAVPMGLPAESYRSALDYVILAIMRARVILESSRSHSGKAENKGFPDVQRGNSDHIEPSASFKVLDFQAFQGVNGYPGDYR
jgi:hypothetical protein